MPDAIETLAENVRTLRKRGGRSVPEAARAAAIHETTWELIEAGALDPDLLTIADIADALGTPLDALLTP